MPTKLLTPNDHFFVVFFWWTDVSIAPVYVHALALVQFQQLFYTINILNMRKILTNNHLLNTLAKWPRIARMLRWHDYKPCSQNAAKCCLMFITATVQVTTYLVVRLWLSMLVKTILFLNTLCTAGLWRRFTIPGFKKTRVFFKCPTQWGFLGFIGFFGQAGKNR